MKELNKINYNDAQKLGQDFRINVGVKWFKDNRIPIYGCGAEDKYTTDYRNSIKYSLDNISRHDRFCPDNWTFIENRQYYIEFKTSSDTHKDTISIPIDEYLTQISDPEYKNTIIFTKGLKAQFISNIYPAYRINTQNEDFIIVNINNLPSCDLFLKETLVNYSKLLNFQEKLKLELKIKQYNMYGDEKYILRKG